MRRFGLILLVSMVLAGCTTQVARVAPTALPAATVTPAPTVTVAPAATATPTHTPSPTATATATRTPTHTATPTHTPSPTPTSPPAAYQLTTGGCCTQPFWSPDGSQVRFIDKPAGNVVGIYGVNVAEPQSAPALVSERLEDSLATGGYIVLRANNTTTIERLADGLRWGVPARGRNVVFSPGAARIAWTLSDEDLPPEQQVTQVWVAELSGENADRVATLRRGGLSGWIDDATLLVSGRETAGAREQVLWAMSVSDGSLRELARAERLRSATLSPSGAWIVYYTTFDPDPAKNGLWVLPTAGGAPQRAAVFGAYQWRPCAEGCTVESDRLLVVPFDPQAAWHEFWELDPATLKARQLTDSEVTPVKIANGDWRVSPDGNRVVFVAAADRNVWVLELGR
jgi:Tol biopolymer transport system component